MEEVKVEVTYTYTPAYRGYRNSLGVPEEPDEDEDLDIETVIDEKGNDRLSELTDSQVKEPIDRMPLLINEKGMTGIIAKYRLEKNV